MYKCHMTYSTGIEGKCEELVFFDKPRDITPKWKKCACPKSNMVPDLIYKFQKICLKRNKVIAQKPNMGCNDQQMDVVKS